VSLSVIFMGVRIERVGAGAALVLFSAALVACGASTNASHSTTTESPASSTTAAVASAPCDSSAIDAGVSKYTRYTSIDSYGCSGDFAYAFVTVPASTPSGGISETVLLMASQDSWQPVNRATYCANGSVPAAIYHSACETS